MLKHNSSQTALLIVNVMCNGPNKLFRYWIYDILYYSLANKNKNISYENELGKNIIDGFICQEEFCLTNIFLLVELY